MPRICANNHSDCCVHCEGSGFAYYVKPYGPCTAGCGDSLAAEKLESTFIDGGHNSKYDIKMHQVSGGTLAAFSESYFSQAPEDSTLYLNAIQMVGQNNPDMKFDIAFSADSVSDAIRQIAEAIDERGENQLFAEA